MTKTLENHSISENLKEKKVNKVLHNYFWADKDLLAKLCVEKFGEMPYLNPNKKEMVAPTIHHLNNEQKKEFVTWLVESGKSKFFDSLITEKQRQQLVEKQNAEEKKRKEYEEHSRLNRLNSRKFMETELPRLAKKRLSELEESLDLINESALQTGKIYAIFFEKGEYSDRSNTLFGAFFSKRNCYTKFVEVLKKEFAERNVLKITDVAYICPFTNDSIQFSDSWPGFYYIKEISIEDADVLKEVFRSNIAQ